MNLAVPRETESEEPRAALTPEGLGKLVQMGAVVSVEAGVGDRIDIDDSAYEEAGADVVSDRGKLLSEADLVIRLGPPAVGELELLAEGCIHVSHLDPFFNRPLVEALASRGVTALCMELIPRTTLAQKMDALSSQASLGGYAAVIVAASRLNKGLPMMMTPAGTLSPARVFIVGAGVAGLQAIATAKRLGARVDAFDTRPEVKEQAESLGARFVEIDIGESAETEGGYAKQLTPEQLEMQRQGMAQICARSDVVITTAKVFGRKPPLIITEEMVAGMRAGSVIVDMAASEHGGNVAGSKLRQEVVTGGVRIVGDPDLPRRVAASASRMYSSNVVNLLTHFWDEESGRLKLDREDEIMQGALVTHDGEIVNEMLRKAYAEE